MTPDGPPVAASSAQAPIDALRAGANEASDRPLVINDGGQTTDYGQCLHRAEAWARGLAALEVERVAVVSDDPANLVTALAATSAIGVEACVYPADSRDAIAELARRFGHTTLMTDQSGLADGSLRILSFAALDATSSDTAIVAGRRAPLLVLTTGTSGPPRGARYDWARLLGQADRHENAHGARWLLTYNLNQFGGIQVLVHALAGHGTLVTPRSRRPRDVIDAIAEHGVTHATGTPTLWRMVASILGPATASRLSLRRITLGGEVAPDDLLLRLGRLFPDAVISHVYAATEVGSVVSVNDGRAGLPLSILHRSDSADVQLRIVDGELVARSSVGMAGYYGDDTGRGEWFATGDLVEVQGDRVQFVGRSTDVVNVGGVKVHPLLIERVVCGIPGVSNARAYGRPNPITGYVIAVDVVPSPGQAPGQTLAKAVRQACADLPPAAQPRSVRIVDQLDTHGGKVVRTRGADT
jgi:acyl-CoA synthetase (AMP-forming)/AMP-acid ligase II